MVTYVEAEDAYMAPPDSVAELPSKVELVTVKAPEFIIMAPPLPEMVALLFVKLELPIVKELPIWLMAPPDALDVFPVNVVLVMPTAPPLEDMAPPTLVVEEFAEKLEVSIVNVPVL